MPLQFTWTGLNELDRVADIRWRCYASKGNEREGYRIATAARNISEDDVCIATADGIDVGTATSLSMNMHIRGKRVPCQGVAWVGTSKAHRRRVGDEPGIASQVMRQIVGKARERREVVSALMPFRVSFYEHFGYGVAERQNVWTIPLSLLPSGNSCDWRFGTKDDAPAMLRCRAQQVASGQCDIETDAAQLDFWISKLDRDHQLFVGTRDGIVSAFAWIATLNEDNRYIAKVAQPGWNWAGGMMAVLELLGSLKDQYSAARIVLPIDAPVNWLLKERQIPHRPVEHPIAGCEMISRMQVRVLDHAAFMDGQELTRSISGKVTIAVRESEGFLNPFELDIDAGVISAAPSSNAPDIELADTTWAAIACGDLRASTAVMYGLGSCREDKLAILDALADGPAPFCYEYF